MSGGRGSAGNSRMGRGPMGRATPQQSFGSFGSTPGGAQPPAPSNAGLAKPTPADSPRFSGRYESRTVQQRPATMGNIATALAGALPGGGVIQAGVSALKGTPGDPYSGAKGTDTSFSREQVGTEGVMRTQRRRRQAAGRSGLGTGTGAQTLG